MSDASPQEKLHYQAFDHTFLRAFFWAILPCGGSYSRQEQGMGLELEKALGISQKGIGPYVFG